MNRYENFENLKVQLFSTSDQFKKCSKRRENSETLQSGIWRDGRTCLLSGIQRTVLIFLNLEFRNE